MIPDLYRRDCSDSQNGLAHLVDRALIGAILLSCVMSKPVAVIAQTKSATEYQVKAAFLYNFAKFVDWPPNAFPNPKQTFDICVYGHDPFGSALEDALLG